VLYCSLGMRRDALFEVCDALACGQERVLMLAEQWGVPEHQEGRAWRSWLVLPWLCSLREIIGGHQGQALLPWR
jgi:hypothetical protein